MKLGLRKVSLKGRLSARISPKRMIRSKIRVPKGMGFITNPKKATYNRVYNRTSVSVDKLVKSSGCLSILFIAVIPIIYLAIKVTT